MIAILLCVLFFVGSFIICACGGLNIPFSEGQRTGIVYKLSKKGLIHKTWEGQMSLQMMTRNSEGQLVNEVFRFSVSDDAVAHQINAAAVRNEPLTLHYTQYFLRGWDKGGTGYDVTGVKSINSNPPALITDH